MDKWIYLAYLLCEIRYKQTRGGQQILWCKCTEKYWYLLKWFICFLFHLRRIIFFFLVTYVQLNFKEPTLKKYNPLHKPNYLFFTELPHTPCYSLREPFTLMTGPDQSAPIASETRELACLHTTHPRSQTIWIMGLETRDPKWMWLSGTDFDYVYLLIDLQIIKK